MPHEMRSVYGLSDLRGTRHCAGLGRLKRQGYSSGYSLNLVLPIIDAATCSSLFTCSA